MITQSVTLASEAVLLGVPTLLVSRAKRGFIDRLVNEGFPLFVVSELDDSLYAAWLAGLHLTDSLESQDWPSTKEQLLEIFNSLPS